MGQHSINEFCAGATRRVRRSLGLFALSFCGSQLVAACATGDCSATLPCTVVDTEEDATNQETFADDDGKPSYSADDVLAAPGGYCRTSSECQGELTCAQSVCCLEPCDGPGQTCGADGVCRDACGAGMADCNGLGGDQCEASLSSRDSCGACGIRCASFDTCGATGCVQPQASLALSVGADIVAFAFDGANNLHVTGALRQPSDLGDTTAGPLGASRTFVAKYTAAGELAWSREVALRPSSLIDVAPGLDGGTGKSIALDEEGNVYLTGAVGAVTDDAVQDAVEPSNASSYMFVASYDAAGLLRWANIYDSAFAGATGEGLAIAAGSRAVYFAARGGPAVDFGDGDVRGDGGNSQNLFLVGLNKSTGSHVWSKALPYAELGTAAFTHLALDSQERLYLSGWWRGALNFGDDPVTGAKTIATGSEPSSDTGFIASYSPINGALRWLRLRDDLSNSRTNAIAVDGNDQVYAAGSFVTPAEHVDGTRDVAVDLVRKAFIVSYDNEGSHRFEVIAGGDTPATSAAATGIGVSGSKVYVSATYSGLIAVGIGNLFSVSEESAGPAFSMDAALISLEAANGAFRWAQSFGSSAVDTTASLVNDAQGPVFSVKAQSALTLDKQLVEPMGNTGTLLVRVTE